MKICVRGGLVEERVALPVAWAGRWRMALEDAPDRALPLLTAAHTRFGLGDGVVTLPMVERYLAEGHADARVAAQVAAAAGATGDAGMGALLGVLAAAHPAPSRVPTQTWTAITDVRTDESLTVEQATRTTTMGEITAPQTSLDEAPMPPPPTDPGPTGAPVAENTNADDSAPAPGRIDEQGRVHGEHAGAPLGAGSPELAEALEAMALALEEGAAWPEGARSSEGRQRLMDRLEEAVAAGLGQDDTQGMAPLTAVRLRVAACALAFAVARREDDETLRGRAGALLGALLVGEPRRSVRAALAATLMAWPELPQEAGDQLLTALTELMPSCPLYDAWETLRAPGDPLWVRHVVYAPEYKLIRDGYEAAGFTRVQERPLQLQCDVPGGRAVRVELRRAQAGVVLTDERMPEEVLILSGLAFAAEPVQPSFPRLVVAAFRRDPFGVPRLADRFPGDHVIGIARGDKPLDDVGFFHALLFSLARKEPYAIMRQRCRDGGPLLTLRTLWPHEPGALRAQGGAPSPFTADPTSIIEHRLTWAVPRPSRRPFDLKWRNDVPDTTSYLALEVGASLACTPLRREDLPVLEPGGFHEGLPDVDVQAGAALWRVTLTRGLCGQAEEALAALVTMHTHARRAEMLGENPRHALLAGAVQAARMVTLHCATREFARDVIAAVLRHAAMPPNIKLEHLLAASEDTESFNALRTAHQKWSAG